MKKLLIKLATKILNKYNAVYIHTGTKILCDDGRYYHIVSSTMTNNWNEGSTFEFNCRQIML